MLSSRPHHAESDVVVVGGGTAGLAAAHHLHAAGLAVTVLEATDRIGGRMATDHRDGYRLDRGSRLTLPGSPALARLPRPLLLRRLTGGVLLHGTTQRHRIGGAAPDQTAPGRVPHPRQESAEDALRPLLDALPHDVTLRAVARQGVALPAGGAAALPGLLAAGLPEGTVRTGVRAVSVATSAVTTEAHGTFLCRAVVVATGAHEAARLLPGLRVPDFRAVTVLHHAAPGGLPAGATLLVDTAERGPLAYSLPASAADPSRAPAGRTLVTSVVTGPRAGEPAELLDKAARPQLAELYGTPADDWRLLAAHHDPYAVPVVPPPWTGGRPARLIDGLYVCGDHRDQPGLAGDLASARRAARALLADAGLPRDPAPVPEEPPVCAPSR
ncbi:FAD-dependent oxidoreductase [Streptomyces sp. NPDC049881]|uniref:FAD-dependent oxidoreductase n=1 Tax=Streptomyces sp. NPDC049881 TaxID=3155778 RepID=UPI0034451703